MKKIVLSGVEVAVNGNLFIDLLGLQKAADVADDESLRPALWLAKWPGQRVAEAESSRLGSPSVEKEDGFIFAATRVAGAYLRAVGSHLEPCMTLEISKMKSDDTKRSQAEARTDNVPSRNALHTLPQHLEASRPASGMIIVNVERGTVGGVDCEVVDARELQAKLGNKAEFSNWMKQRIHQLNFVENQDFGINDKVVANSGRGRPPKEYTLTLVMAKKIAMAEHTDAGNAVRDYFLDRERISYEAPASSSDIEARFERLEGRVFDRMDRMFDRMTGIIERVVERSAPAQIAAPTVVVAIPAALKTAEAHKVVGEQPLSVKALFEDFEVKPFGYKAFYTHAAASGIVKAQGAGYVLTDLGMSLGGVESGGKTRNVRFVPSQFHKVLWLLKSEFPSMQFKGSGQEVLFPTD